MKEIYADNPVCKWQLTQAGDEGYQWLLDNLGGTWIKTSYNATTNGFRYNFAGIGYEYDPIDDAFIAPMPQCGHESLLLNDKKRWECSECVSEYEANSL